jgi:hypothetical protein
MRNIKLFFLLYVAFVLRLDAQENVSISLEVNYNSFSQTSLKEFQNEFIDDISEIQLRVTDNFPSNIGYTLGVKVENINTNFFVFYNATGGRLSYSDFSGVIRITQNLKGIGLGGEYQLALGTKERFHLNLRSFIHFSSLNLDSYSEIAETINTDSIDFNSRDLGLGFAFMYEYPIAFFKVKIRAGYDWTFVGDVFLKNDDDAFLRNDNNDNVKTNWSGFRTGLVISIPLN